MDPGRNDPPSHEETMIESSIVEIPPPYTKPPRPRPPLRKGPVVLSLLLALGSLGGGAFVLHRRTQAALERGFLEAGERVLSTGEDPSGVLLRGDALPASLRSRVGVQDLIERLEDRARLIEARGHAERILAEAGADIDFATRGARLHQALTHDPSNADALALKAHLQLEVWASRGEAPRQSEWRALLSSLGSPKAGARGGVQPGSAALVARARVRLACESSPSGRTHALQDLAEAARVDADPALDPTWAAYARGWRALLLHKPQEALEPLDRLLLRSQIAQRPTLRALALLQRARARWSLGDLSSATQDAAQAKSSDPLVLEAEALCLWLQSEDLRRSETQSPKVVWRATPLLGSAKDLAARRPRSGVVLAAWAQLGSLDSPSPTALERARQAVQVERSSDLAHLSLARLLQARGQITAARAAARQAVLRGRSVAAYLLRAELSLQARAFDEARQELSAAAALSPNHADLLQVQGALALETFEPERALESARAILEARPEDPSALVLEARALGGLQRWEESAQRAARALALAEDHSAARLAQARARAETGQAVVALADLARLPQDVLIGQFAAEVAYLRARCHRDLREVPQARAASERFLQLTYASDRRRRLAQRYLEDTR